nr:MAG TPA: hypothetical protein [Caudoviricetes sp.]DAX43754.1 MAG TPA: hypothetical protein [Caudoviricetes sp.]
MPSPDIRGFCFNRVLRKIRKGRLKWQIKNGH